MSTVCYLIAPFLLAIFASCDRSDPRPIRAETSPGAEHPPSTEDVTAAVEEPALTPLQTVRRLHELRLARHWPELGEHIVPEHSAAAVDLARASDRLIQANRSLQTAIIAELGRSTALRFDRAQAGNAVGVLSIDVDVLDERIDGDRATVTIQIGGRVPVERVELLRVDGRWLIQTDPPIDGVADALERLARVMHSAVERLQSEHLTAEALQRELDAQQAPVLRRLNALTRDHRTP